MTTEERMKKLAEKYGLEWNNGIEVLNGRITLPLNENRLVFQSQVGGWYLITIAEGVNLIEQFVQSKKVKAFNEAPNTIGRWIKLPHFEGYSIGFFYLCELEPHEHQYDYVTAYKEVDPLKPIIPQIEGLD